MINCNTLCITSTGILNITGTLTLGLNAGRRTGTVCVGITLFWTTASTENGVADKSWGTRTPVRANRISTHRSLMTGTRLALVRVLALAVDQLVAAEARADRFMVDNGTISAATGVVVARVDTFVRLLVTIPIRTALVPRQTLDPEAAHLRIPRIAQMSLRTLAHGFMLRRNTHCIPSTLDRIAGVLALARDTA